MRTPSFLYVLVLFLAAGCGLVNPTPPGTRAVAVTVTNATGTDAHLSVATAAGDIPGSVRPPVAPARSTTDVTVYVPTTGDWTLYYQDKVRGEGGFSKLRLGDLVARGCPLVIQMGSDSVSVDCAPGS